MINKEQIRNAALEEAARDCEIRAKNWLSYESEPDMQERGQAAEICAAAIRSFATTSTEPAKEAAPATTREQGLAHALSIYADMANWRTDANGIARIWHEPDSSTPDAYCGAEYAIKVMEDYHANVPCAPAPSAKQEPSDQVASEKEALRRMSVQGMADCMDMVRSDLVEMGVIDKSVAPMFIPEAVAAYVKRLATTSASASPAAPADDEICQFFNERGFYPENISEDNRSRFYDSVRAFATSPAAAVAAPTAQQQSRANLAPKWAGQFDSFDQWVNKAQSRLARPAGEPQAVCVDSLGRRCWIGKQFMRARDEGTFPVRYFWDCEPAAPVAGSQHVPAEFTEAQFAAAARALSDNHAAVCNVDKDDTWLVYGESFLSEARTALIAALAAAAPAVPVPADQDQARDAARYRWLRHADLDALADANWGRDGQVYEGEALDAAIDAAIDAAMAAPSLQQPKEGAA